MGKIIHPDELESIISQAGHSCVTGEGFYKEVRLKRNNDGKFRWHLLRATPIKDDQGNAIISWVGVATDIHEQKLMEQKKDEFMNIGRHEMKAPLSVIRGYLELLEMTLDVKTEEALFVNKALCSVTRLTNLINELLEAGKMQFNVNLLKRINRELDADFDINAFEHYPVYNEHEGIAKSYLKSKKEQWVTISGQRFHFTKSELIHTEISRKYSDAILKNILSKTDITWEEKIFENNNLFANYILVKKLNGNSV